MTHFKTLGLSLIAVLFVAGCSKKEDPPVNASEDVAPIVSSGNCDSASIKNSLARALSVQTNDDVNALIGRYSISANIHLPTRVQERLSKISLDFQNISANGDSCQAEMVVNLPSEDIERANRYYSKNSLPDAAALAEKRSVSFKDGRLSSSIRYHAKDGAAILSDRPNALMVVADIMSASAYIQSAGGTTSATPAEVPVSLSPPETTPTSNPAAHKAPATTAAQATLTAPIATPVVVMPPAATTSTSDSKPAENKSADNKKNKTPPKPPADTLTIKESQTITPANATSSKSPANKSTDDKNTANQTSSKTDKKSSPPPANDITIIERKDTY